MATRRVLAAVVMIATGYVGEIERTDMTVRAVWGFISILPFLYILFVLWSEMSSALNFELISSDSPRRPYETEGCESDLRRAQCC